MIDTTIPPTPATLRETAVALERGSLLIKPSARVKDRNDDRSEVRGIYVQIDRTGDLCGCAIGQIAAGFCDTPPTWRQRRALRDDAYAIITWLDDGDIFGLGSDISQMYENALAPIPDIIAYIRKVADEREKQER